MAIRRLYWQNYKAFAQRQELEIRPLTLLIGKNSAGKSVVSRLPLLLARAFSAQAEAPLECEFEDFSLGGSAVDLIHGKSVHGSLLFGIELTDGSAFEGNFQYYSEIQGFQVTRATYSGGVLAKPHDFEWCGQDPRSENRLYRNCSTGATLDIEFLGLLPEVLDLPRSCEKEWQTLKDRLCYLGPFREQPQRRYGFSGGRPKDVGMRGGRTPVVLADDYQRGEKTLIGEIREWMEDNLGAWKLDLEPVGDGFSIVFRHPLNSLTSVNLVDVGAGLAQVLPIVVQSYLHRDRSALDIVEQPELHLHPAAHGPLADLYIRAIGSSNARFVIETHSENFILRLRRRVAEGTLDPKSVVLYWVDGTPAQLRRIQIDHDGGVDSWPTGVFSEDFVEVAAINNARRP